MEVCLHSPLFFSISIFHVLSEQDCSAHILRERDLLQRAYTEHMLKANATHQQELQTVLV